MKNAGRLFLIVSLSLFHLLAVSCYCQNEKKERPSRGSIEFGAPNLPVEWPEEQIAPFRDVFSRIAKAVIPSVVSVVPTRVDTVLFYRNPFYRFFEDPFGSPDGQEPPVEKRERRVKGLGTGVIVSKNGYILTNYHVVAGATDIEVRFADNRVFPAKVAGLDSLSDVAVIRITGKVPQNVPVAYLGKSNELEVGDWVAAIGNPFSLTSTVTSGIVSALGRQVEGAALYQNFIQTDAAINPGNSGGPLVNINGAVVGINTLIFSQTGGFMGIGFAIPINLARKVMEDLIYESKVIRGWIGVSVQEITSEARKALGLTTPGGVIVSNVVEGQPAAKAGLREGDVIVSIAGQEVQDPAGLLNTVATLRPGTEAPLVFIRNGKRMEAKIRIAERTPQTTAQAQPRDRQPRPQRGEVDNKTGIGVVDLTPELRRRFGIPNDARGAMVAAIAPSVTDARAALQPGDVITRAKVEGKEWKDVGGEKDYRGFAEEIKKGNSVLLLVRRGGDSFYVPFVIEGE